MHFSTLALASFASVALAVTTTASSGYECAAQNIVDACKSTIEAQVQSCQGNDWDCLCTQYTNLLTCYNNCPGDPVRSSVNQQVQQFCAAASQYGTTTRVAATTTGASVAQTSATTTTSGSPSGARNTGTPSSIPNAAASLQIGGSLAAILLTGLGLVA